MHEWAKMCAGVKYRARGAPAKTRYCGHYFSRLMRDMTNPVQAACPAYYMGEEQGGSRGCWDIGGGATTLCVAHTQEGFLHLPCPL